MSDDLVAVVGTVRLKYRIDKPTQTDKIPKVGDTIKHKSGNAFATICHVYSLRHFVWIAYIAHGEDTPHMESLESIKDDWML